MNQIVHPDNRRAVDLLIQDIQALESRCYRLKLHYTARGLNAAKNACGWELAGSPDNAARALKGDHSYRK